ncbi:hypothetical protein ANO14919_103590 [Xylariales sp. No.14919]|nr:hypothetical protein ANO14919_103590 [Xylariales sp. No.14919]
MLERSLALQCGRKVNDLSERAKPTSARYSNADLTKLFDGSIGGWNPTKPSVHISHRHTAVIATIQNGQSSDIRVQLFIGADFKAACNELSDQLSCCSLPVEETFPKSNEFAQSGEIRLHTGTDTTMPIILWVYHNVSIRAELLFPEHSESVSSARDDASTWFNSVTDELFRYIRNGCVLEGEEVTRPKPQKDTSTSTAHVGETFTIDVIVDEDCLHDVECDDNKLVYADFTIIESCYRFTFLAIEQGESSIHFNFAHARTFNSSSVDFTVRIEPD